MGKIFAGRKNKVIKFRNGDLKDLKIKSEEISEEIHQKCREKNSEFIKSVERKEFILNIMTDRNRF